MAPEQMKQGRGVDARSDIYAVGVMAVVLGALFGEWSHAGKQEQLTEVEAPVAADASVRSEPACTNADAKAFAENIARAARQATVRAAIWRSAT